MAANAPPAEEHPLALRVMRLCRPSFHVKTQFLFDGDELPLSAEIDLVARDPLELNGLTSTFALPQSFGNIYLGEAFSCCIRVFNHSRAPVQNVVVKAELQSNSQRVVLLDTTAHPRVCSPREGADFVVSHELRELNVHILICAVQYTDRLGERKFFRKYFRFSVLNPLVINTKVTEFMGNIYLEAQMQNQMVKALCFETVRFDPAPNVTVIRSSVSESSSNSQSLVLAPSDVRQFLFQLGVSPQLLRSGQRLPIGKLEVLWRSSMGEPGRLQTLPIHSKMSQPCDLTAEMVNAPSVVDVESVFKTNCRITNTSTRPMTLSLSLSAMTAAALIPVGTASQVIGEIRPSQTINVPLQFFAAAPGIHSITGIQVIDTSVQPARTIDLDVKTEVFVQGEGADDAPDMD